MKVNQIGLISTKEHSRLTITRLMKMQLSVVEMLCRRGWNGWWLSWKLGQLKESKTLLSAIELELRARGLVGEPCRGHREHLIDLMLSVRGDRQETWEVGSSGGVSVVDIVVATRHRGHIPSSKHIQMICLCSHPRGNARHCGIWWRLHVLDRLSKRGGIEGVNGSEIHVLHAGCIGRVNEQFISLRHPLCSIERGHDRWNQNKLPVRHQAIKCFSSLLII